MAKAIRTTIGPSNHLVSSSSGSVAGLSPMGSGLEAVAKAISAYMGYRQQNIENEDKQKRLDIDESRYNQQQKHQDYLDQLNEKKDQETRDQWLINNAAEMDINPETAARLKKGVFAPFVGTRVPTADVEIPSALSPSTEPDYYKVPDVSPDPSQNPNQSFIKPTNSELNRRAALTDEFKRTQLDTKSQFDNERLQWQQHEAEGKGQLESLKLQLQQSMTEGRLSLMQAQAILAQANAESARARAETEGVKADTARTGQKMLQDYMSGSGMFGQKDTGASSGTDRPDLSNVRSQTAGEFITGNGATPYNSMTDIPKAWIERQKYNFMATPMAPLIQETSLDNLRQMQAILGSRALVAFLPKFAEHQAKFGYETPAATYVRLADLSRMMDESLQAIPKENITMGSNGNLTFKNPPTTVQQSINQLNIVKNQIKSALGYMDQLYPGINANLKTTGGVPINPPAASPNGVASPPNTTPNSTPKTSAIPSSIQQLLGR